MLHLIIALAALELSNGFLFFVFKRNYKLMASVRDQYKKQAETQSQTLISQRDEITRLRESIKEMNNGWFPATYTNSRSKYGATFKYRGHDYGIADRVNIFSIHGVTFINVGFVSYDNLLIRLF